MVFKLQVLKETAYRRTPRVAPSLGAVQDCSLEARTWRLDILAPSSPEELQALAQPAPEWCDRSLWKPPIEGFVSQLMYSTRNAQLMLFRSSLRPPPCRGAALPLLISGGEPEKRPISRTRPQVWPPWIETTAPFKPTLTRRSNRREILGIRGRGRFSKGMGRLRCESSSCLS